MIDPGNPDKAPLLDHEVDGIRELDNLLPRWWVWLFYLTTAFAVGLTHYPQWYAHVSRISL